MGAVVATYPELPCRSCGGRRAYWVQTTWDTQQPFCGDCNRLLGTYKAMSGGEKGVAWVFAGIGIFILGLIGIAVLQDSLESAGERRAAAREAAQVSQAKELITEARSSATSQARLTELLSEPEECTKTQILKLPRDGQERSFDCNEVLQANVALNVNATTQMLDDLSTSDSEWVRASAARNPALSIDRQRALASDPAESVRASLAMNSQLDEEVQMLLANESENQSGVKVGLFLASNNYLSLPVFQQLSRSMNPAIAIAIYCNDALPEDLRQKLPKRFREISPNKLEQQNCKSRPAPFSFQDDWVVTEISQELP